MAMRKFKTIFLEEARDFILSLPEQPKSKIIYNIRKVEGGIINSELFKKLDNTDIWEFRTLYNGIQYRLFAFWDTEGDTLVVAIGKIGTPKRDKFEQDLKEELQAYHIGEAIKQARMAKNLTQEELGEKMGVQRSQVSRLEKGKSISFSSLLRAFRAMDIPLTLEMGEIGRVSLC